jgi:NADH dehydrogenase/NADH:ubiquinone oxidoreductase subunit G
MIITIDGKECICKRGEYILDIAKREGIKIPALCHHGGLSAQGCCRVCIVEVEQNDRHTLVTACIYPVEKECKVFTNSENVIRQRKMILSLLQSLAPDSSEVSQLCEASGARKYDRFITKENGKCILCGLCVKACESLGTGAISTAQRGIEKVVTTPYNEPSFVCVGCASCAAVCPTDAIEVSENGGERKIWNRSFQFKFCNKCGAKVGTLAELYRSSKKANAEIPELCENCRKKAITDAFAATYGS